MLPLQQAYEEKHSLIEYLRATFCFKDKGVNDAFYNFINHPEEGVFKMHGEDVANYALKVEEEKIQYLRKSKENISHVKKIALNE